MKFRIGDKVFVKGHWNFPNDCAGTIKKPPDIVVNLNADKNPWQGIHRFVKGKKGVIEFYWVKFDEPQMDGDGDGPYPEAEIEAECLKPLIKEI